MNGGANYVNMCVRCVVRLVCVWGVGVGGQGVVTVCGGYVNVTWCVAMFDVWGEGGAGLGCMLSFCRVVPVIFCHV